MVTFSNPPNRTGSQTISTISFFLLKFFTVRLWYRWFVCTECPVSGSVLFRGCSGAV